VDGFPQLRLTRRQGDGDTIGTCGDCGELLIKLRLLGAGGRAGSFRPPARACPESRAFVHLRR
jgi:hypothetical protein